MSVRRSLSVATLTALVSMNACSRAPTMVQGTRDRYEMPPSYLQQSPLGHGGASAHDKGPVVRLTIPVADTALRTAPQGDSLSVLLFSDKPYGPDVLKNGVKRCTGPGTDRHKVGNLFAYSQGDKWGTETCYATFDADRGDRPLDPSDYTVRASQGVPSQIGGTTITPLGSCQVFFTRDGLLVQVSAVGPVCAPEAYPDIVSSLNGLLSTWRTDPASGRAGQGAAARQP